jgi:hypothetical protein
MRYKGRTASFWQQVSKSDVPPRVMHKKPHRVNHGLIVVQRTSRLSDDRIVAGRRLYSREQRKQL